MKCLILILLIAFATSELVKEEVNPKKNEGIFKKLVTKSNIITPKQSITLAVRKPKISRIPIKSSKSGLDEVHYYRQEEEVVLVEAEVDPVEEEEDQ